MADEIIPIKCPACGHTEVAEGKTIGFSIFSIRFVLPMWVVNSWLTTYVPNSYVCLECGILFHKIEGNALKELKRLGKNKSS